MTLPRRCGPWSTGASLLVWSATSIGTCSLAGRDIGSAMVRQGWALDYQRYSGGAYAAEQLEAERTARVAVRFVHSAVGVARSEVTVRRGEEARRMLPARPACDISRASERRSGRRRTSCHAARFHAARQRGDRPDDGAQLLIVGIGADELAGRTERGEGLDAHDRDPLAAGARCHMWDRLFPVEQARITQLLVERVIVRLDGLEIRLRVEGISSLVGDLRRREPERTAA